MQRIWKYIYVCWAVLCVLTGYRTLSVSRAPGFVGWPFVVEGFIFFCVAPLAITALRRRFGFETVFRRPSLGRPPFGKGDILQVFRLFSISAALIMLGACFALPNADHRGLMMFISVAVNAAGFFVGERIVYLVYARKISEQAATGLR